MELEEREGFFRRNSAALINNELMVDCGEYIFDFCLSINDSSLYDGVTDIIITYDHPDHFSRESVLKLAESQKIRVGCNKQIADAVGKHSNIEYVLFKFLKKTE